MTDYITNADAIGAATEWTAEAVATASPDSEYGEAAEKAAIFLKVTDILKEDHAVANDPNYPTNVQNGVELLLWLSPFDGHNPGDLSQLFATAWNTIDTVPDNLSTGMTKADFYADLETKYPDLFVDDGSGGLLTPSLITTPGSSFNLSGIDTPHVTDPIPSILSAPSSDVGTAQSETSPLVLDLTEDHTGIALTTFNASTTTTFFDIDNSGFATQTAWTGDDMGLLCRDLNGNGKIDNAGELFGSSTVDGFSLLASLDSNGDHRIDANDAAWSTLKVWIDSNGDAVTQDGELHTLDDLGIKSIDLAGVTASTDVIDGNPISHTSTFTFDDNSTATIADAWFVHDPMNSYYNSDYTLDTDTLFLPDLRGYGTLPELDIAMSLDSTLKGMVSDFMTDFTPASFADPSSLDGAVTDILYQWAGVTDVDSSSRGPNIDARQLEFLEHLFGEGFSQLGGSETNPDVNAATDLTRAWDEVFQTFKDQLLIQSGADSLFASPVAYDLSTGTITGDLGLSETAISGLTADAPSPGSSNLAYWEQVAHFLDDVKGLDSLTTDENTWMNDAVYASDSSLTWDDVKNDLSSSNPGETITGTSGDDTLTGTSGDDTIYGYGGHDTIDGGEGNDAIHGGADGSTIHGGYGNDTIDVTGGDNTLYGDYGNDTITAAAGNDTLEGGPGGNTLEGGAGNDNYVFGGGELFQRSPDYCGYRRLD